MYSVCSVQFKMVSMYSGTPICAPLYFLDVPPMLPSTQFQYSSDWLWPFSVLLLTPSTFHDSLLRAIDDAMSLAVRSQVVSQAPQHFRSSQSTCDGCFAYQSRSVICQCIRYNACPLKLTVPLRRESGFKRKDIVGQNGHNTFVSFSLTRQLRLTLGLTNMCFVHKRDASN